MRKLISLVLVIALAVSMLVGCGGSGGNDGKKDVKVGLIMVGDDTEGYTKAHIDGIKKAAENCGISDDQLVWKYSIPESDECTKAAEELVAAGCTLIIANSYGHEDYMNAAAQKYPDVNFVSMTGDYAAVSGSKNYFNAFTRVYESRYVSGVVAGMKIKELADAGKIPAKSYTKDKKVKVGYVGAHPYAEVVSGYTAFFLGIKSIYKDVSMEVTYTNSWFDVDKEAAAAEALMKDNCVIIGQHADSTGAPAACQKAKDNGTVVYSVGYNVDMLSVAKTAALTSPTNEWSVYYTDLFKAVLDGKEIPQDWAKGYDADAVAITDLGPEVAKGTDAKVKEVIAGIKDGSVHVFDTANFTITGKNVDATKKNVADIKIDKKGKVTSCPIDLSHFDFTVNPPKLIYKGATKDALQKDGKNTFFDESSLRSAPYFSLRIDDITELQ